MKIAICSDSFLPIIDGVGRVTYEYADRLARRGHECHVITPVEPYCYKGGLSFEINDYWSVKTSSSYQYRTGLTILDPHYLEKIRYQRFDVIHAHTPASSGLEAVRLASRLRVPLIGTFHSKYYDDFKKMTGSDMVASLGVKYVVSFYERCDEVWTVSNNAAETLRSYGYKGDIVVVPNGSITEKAVDPSAAQRAREQFNIPQGRPMLLYVGQIDRKKNLVHIMESAGILAKTQDFTLVFAGMGVDMDMLKAKAKGMGIEDKVIFTGHIYDKSLLDGLYGLADLFIFPSLYDTAGLVVCEAALMGTPSLVVKGSAPAERATHMKNAVVCDDTPSSIAGAISDYIALPQSQKDIICQNAYRDIPIPWDNVIDIAEKRYCDIIEKGTVKRDILGNFSKSERRVTPRVVEAKPKKTGKIRQPKKESNVVVKKNLEI
ncbi:MAG: glycosyltransferase family 4 protein [Clostridiales bacterium]|nr:glycosyltransferase family 4 protein [Clostridiales bacterium]